MGGDESREHDGGEGTHQTQRHPQGHRNGCRHLVPHLRILDQCQLRINLRRPVGVVWMVHDQIRHQGQQGQRPQQGKATKLTQHAGHFLFVRGLGRYLIRL